MFYLVQIKNSFAHFWKIKMCITQIFFLQIVFLEIFLWCIRKESTSFIYCTWSAEMCRFSKIEKSAKSLISIWCLRQSVHWLEDPCTSRLDMTAIIFKTGGRHLQAEIIQSFFFYMFFIPNHNHCQITKLQKESQPK